MTADDVAFLLCMVSLMWLFMIAALIVEGITYLLAYREGKKTGRLNKKDWKWIRLD